MRVLQLHFDRKVGRHHHWSCLVMSSAALLLTLAYSLLAMGRIKVVHVVGMGPATGWTSPCKGVTFRKCTHVRAGRLLLRSPLSSGFCVLVLHHNMGVLSMQVGMSVSVWHIPPRGHNWRMLTTLLRDICGCQPSLLHGCAQPQDPRNVKISMKRSQLFYATQSRHCCALCCRTGRTSAPKFL